MRTARPSLDIVDGAQEIEHHFRVRLFRLVLGVTLTVHVLHLAVVNRWVPGSAWPVITLALAIGLAVEYGPERLWQRLRTPRHEVGVTLLGGLYTVYLGSMVAIAGADLRAPATWWMSVYPCYVILAGAIRSGLAQLVGTVLWFGLVYVAVDQGWLPPGQPQVRDPLYAMLSAAGSSAALGLFLVISVQRRFALHNALLAAIERLAGEREQALAEANAKAMLLANTSHELRTPLNGVLGMAELMATPGLDAAQQRELLRLMRQSADIARHLVDDVLDYSKLQAGRLDVEKVEFPLRATVFGIAELFAPQAHGKGIEIGVCFTPEVPLSVLGDPLRLRQILANFVSNAVKFTAEGGVQICVERLADQRIRFEVHDSGIGLSEEALAGLFKPFVQASGSTARLYGGSGLGLSICKQLAERMGGRVAARSVAGQGSVFSLELPLPERPGPGRSYPDLPPLAGVCLVCANRFVHWTVSDMLKPRHLPVQWVASLEDPALDDLAERTVVVIDSKVLADARSARQWPALTRRLHRLGTVPVLLSAMDGSDAPASVTGTTLTLYKPVRLSRLLAALTSALEPLPSVAADAPAPAAHDASPALAGVRVLVAEDNPINQIVASGMLEQLGAHVQVAEGGEQTLALLAQKDFDVVLLDCEMPDLGGTEVARRWRAVEAREGRRRTPIIAATGHSRRDAWPACKAAGMDDFLSKPYFADQLCQRVKAWAGAGSAAAGPR